MLSGKKIVLKPKYLQMQNSPSIRKCAPNPTDFSKHSTYVAITVFQQPVEDQSSSQYYDFRNNDFNQNYPKTNVWQNVYLRYIFL